MLDRYKKKFLILQGLLLLSGLFMCLRRFLMTGMLSLCMVINFINTTDASPVIDINTPELMDEIARSSRVDKHGPIVLYDNIHYRHGKKEGKYPVLARGSTLLVPADTINVNLNMTYLFHAPVKPGRDMLGNLIYADIELKKMLERYSEIQKKALKLSEKAVSPASVNNYSIYLPTFEYSIQSDPDLQREKTSGFEASVRLEKQLSVARASRRVGNTIKRTISTAHTYTAPPEAKITASRTDTTDLLSSSMPDSDAAKKLSNISVKMPNFTRYGMEHVRNKTVADKNTEEIARKVKTVSRAVSVEELPWWIKTPSEFITYCMNNKLEAGLILLGFIFLMNIIGAIFRR